MLTPKTVVLLWFLIGFFMVTLPNAALVKAAGPGAYFTGVLVTDGAGVAQLLGGGTAKVYSNQAPVWENTTFFNNITGFPFAIFYQVIYVTTGTTTFSFTGDELNVTSGSSGSYNWYESGGFAGSGNIHMRIELWWNSSGSPIFEDAVEFDILVVSLVLTDWTQSQTIVQRGLQVPVQLSLNFTNGGNDVMYNVSISLLNSTGLQLSPYIRSLGNLSAAASIGTFFNATGPSSSALGPHDVEFGVSFADFRGVQHSVNQTAIVIVSKLGTVVQVYASPSTVKVKGVASLRVTLSDNNGNPVANVPVTLNIGNLPGVALQTDSSGNAIYQYQALEGSGVYLLRASYSGDSGLAPNTGSSLLTVNPLSTSLALSAPGSRALGQSAALSATLLDEAGQPVVGGNVTFFADGLSVGWTLTDLSGVAVLYYFPRSSGNLQLKATYLGSDIYSGAESSMVQLNISPASLLVIAGIDLTLPFILVVAGGVFLLAARSLRQRSKIQA